MAMAATAYAEYRQVDEASPQLQQQVTVADSFKGHDVKREVRHLPTNQPSATVLVGYVDAAPLSLVLCGDLQDSVHGYAQLGAGDFEFSVGSRYEVCDVSALKTPEREHDLIVKMPAKHVRDCKIRVMPRVKAVPNPILYTREG